jgi:regulatory protein
MPVVTRLAAVNRNATRVQVELDGAPWIELEGEVVLKNALAKGLELGPEEQRRLVEENDFVRARRAAAILLKTRPRSVAEMRRKLLERQHPAGAVDRVVAHNLETGALDDAAFARLYARNQLKTRLVGPARIEGALRRLGVGAVEIRQALEECGADERDEQERRARRLAGRRGALRRGDDPAKARKRLFERLQRAGFDSEIAREAVEEALRDASPEEDRSPEE